MVQLIYKYFCKHIHNGETSVLCSFVNKVCPGPVWDAGTNEHSQI